MRWLVVAGVLVAPPVFAQTPAVKNPSALTFACPDHAQDTGHEIDIVRAADGVIIQTIQGGDPPSRWQR